MLLTGSQSRLNLHMARQLLDTQQVHVSIGASLKTSAACLTCFLYQKVQSPATTCFPLRLPCLSYHANRCDPDTFGSVRR